MSSYKYVHGGVLNRDTGEIIPENPKETKWQAFLKWKKNNEPDPIFGDIELLAQAKGAKLMEIEAAYTAAATAPVTVGVFTYPGGEDAAVELDRIIRSAALLALDDCDVPDVDGIDRTLTVAGAQTVLKAMLTALRPLTKARRKKLRDIRIADNVAEVEAITW